MIIKNALSENHGLREHPEISETCSCEQVEKLNPFYLKRAMEEKMESKKFDPKKLKKLNDPGRLTYLNPDLIWPALELSSPEILVDIGAGTGFFASLFSKKMGKGKVYACDISDTMISWMKENLSGEVRDCVIPVKMEESSIPLPDGIADLVYMINLHHELDEPVKIIEESYRILRSTGKFLIIDWKKEETPDGPPLSLRVAKDTIESHMRQGGFSLVIHQAILPYHYCIIAEKIPTERKGV